MKTTQSLSKFSLAKFFLLTALAATTGLLSGCYVYTETDPYPPLIGYCSSGCDMGCQESSDACYPDHYDDAVHHSSSFAGDISFAWSFDDAPSCAAAGVSQIYVQIEGVNTPDSDRINVPCFTDRATSFGFTPGTYWIRLEGLDSYGHITYDAEFEFEVLGGYTVDLGFLLLQALAAPPPPPPPATGSLTVDWAFRYPTDEPVYECEYAGVEWVEVIVTDGYDNVLFDDLISCIEGPLTIEGVDPGPVFVELIGFGTWSGQSSPFYLTTPYEATVMGNTNTDMGILPLDRNEAFFGDFMIDWSFAGHSCAAEGIDEVLVRIIRSDGAILEDEFVASCRDANLVRTTFLPGDYEVEVSAQSYCGNCWSGLELVSLIPDTTAAVDVWTELSYCN